MTVRTTLLFLAPLALALAVQPARAQHHDPGTTETGTSGMKMDHTMMASMDSMDARLDSLVALMNGAKGARKVDAMAGILNTLVSHHLEMRREMHRAKMEHGGMKQDQPDRGMNRGMQSDSAQAGGQPHQH